MYKVVINNYEEREKELLSENQVLRRSMFQMYSDLQTHVKSLRGESPSVKSKQNTSSCLDPLDFFSVRIMDQSQFKDFHLRTRRTFYEGET